MRARPKLPAALLARGYLYARLRRWEESLAAFNLYLEVTPVGTPVTAEAGTEREKVMKFVNEKVVPEVLK